MTSLITISDRCHSEFGPPVPPPPPLQLIELFIEVELDFGLGKLTIKHKFLRKSPHQLIFQKRLFEAFAAADDFVK